MLYWLEVLFNPDYYHNKPSYIKIKSFYSISHMASTNFGQLLKMDLPVGKKEKKGTNSVSSWNMLWMISLIL